MNGNRTSYEGSAERLLVEKDQIFSSVRDGKQVSMMERPHSSGMYGSVKSSFTSTYPVKITAPFAIPTRSRAKASDTKLYRGPEINLNKTESHIGQKVAQRNGRPVHGGPVDNSEGNMSDDFISSRELKLSKPAMAAGLNLNDNSSLNSLRFIQKNQSQMSTAEKNRTLVKNIQNITNYNSRTASQTQVPLK